MNGALQDLADRVVREVPDGAPVDARPPAGAVLAVHTPDGEQTAVAGSRTGAPGDPMTPDTLHDLASVTKVAATTVALMRLATDGLLSLNLKAAAVLPGFAGGLKDDITVRDLLEHRSGLAPWWPLYLAAGDGPSPLAAHRTVDQLPLHHSPRAEHHYSDLGFIQLGRILAVVAGLPLAEAVRTLVHEPLGLDLGYRTATADAASGAPIATSAPDDRIEREMIDSGVPYAVPFSSDAFTRWRTGPIHGVVHDGNTFHALGGVGGHAGLFGTVPELLRLAVALAHADEHEAIWSPTVVQEFTRAGRSEVPAEATWAQALGFRRYSLDLHGGRVDVLGHPGFTGAALAFAPAADIAVAFGTNRLLHGGTPVPTELILREVLQVAFAPTTSPPSITPVDPSRGPS